MAPGTPTTDEPTTKRTASKKKATSKKKRTASKKKTPSKKAASKPVANTLEKPDSNASATKPAEEPKNAKAGGRQYEVVHTIVVGNRERRQRGARVTEQELGGLEAAQRMIDAGVLRDPNAPIPPSQAEGRAAFLALLEVGLKTGAIARDGAAYSIGEESYESLDTFTNQVPLTRLRKLVLESVSE